MTKFITILKAKIFHLKQPLKTYCTIVLYHFIELGTPELNNENSINPNISLSDLNI